MLLILLVCLFPSLKSWVYIMLLTNPLLFILLHRELLWGSNIQIWLNCTSIDILIVVVVVVVVDLDYGFVLLRFEKKKNKKIWIIQIQYYKCGHLDYAK
jgi:hypothetical protein